MRRTSAYMIAGAIGAVALSGTIAIGYAQHRMQPEPRERIALGSSVSTAQQMERRRGRAAAIAVIASAP